MKVLAWWSGGITSAVACRIALERYENVHLAYIHINTHDPDTARFKADCEAWYGQTIHPYQHKRFKDQFEVIESQRYINGPVGAPCTKKLKKEVRYLIEKEREWTHQVHGFEFEAQEISRAIWFQKDWAYTNPIFPLIEERLSKNECAGIVRNAGILLPNAYKMGYEHNNCVGCVKGGMGYWNQIRRDYPAIFRRMAELERKIGASCISGTYLDELDPKAGNKTEKVRPECGIFCSTDYAYLENKVARILSGELTINAA